MFRQLFAMILLTAVGAGAGYGVSLIQPTQWQAVAGFEPPKAVELGNYLSLSSTYSLVSGADNAADLTKVEAQAAAQSYAEFQKVMNSVELRQQFLRDDENLKLQANLENQPLEAVVQAVEKSITFANNELKVTSINVEQANRLIGDYIRFANAQAKERLNKDLIAKWQTLFQQVKSAAEAKIDNTWENKLNMMKSVQPLDNQLVAFRFTQMPKVEAVPFDFVRWIGAGAGAGFVLSLVMILLFRTGRPKSE